MHTRDGHLQEVTVTWGDYELDLFSTHNPGWGGGLPYKSDGGDRQKV